MQIQPAHKVFFLTFFFIFIQIYLFFNLPPYYTYHKHYSTNIQNVPNLTNANDKYTKMIINTFSTAFQEHIKHCPFNDELRPITMKCLDSYGFYATIIESFETSYFMHLNTSDYIKEFLQKNFDCSKLEWVSRREFWSRVVGSLIGSYIVSGDDFFLNHAEKCAGLAIQIEKLKKYPLSYINPKIHSFKERVKCDRIMLNEFSYGIPELFSLYTITSKTKYIKHALRFVKKISTSQLKNDSISIFMSISCGTSSYTLQNIDVTSINFFRNIGIANSVLQHNKLSQILNFAEKHIANHIKVKNYSFTYYPLFDIPDYFNTKSIIKKKEFSFLFQFAKNETNLKFFQNETNFESHEFIFDATFQRLLIRLLSMTNSSFEKTQIKNFAASIFQQSINKFKIGNGFSGFIRQTDGKFTINNIQHTNLFGQWLKCAILLDDSYDEMIKALVFNERGHILKCNFDYYVL